jgi:hypothetical protein
MHIRRFFRASASLGLLFVLTGCPKPDEAFEDYQARFLATCAQFPDDPRCKVVSTDCVVPEGCMVPAAGEMDGLYYLSLTPPQSPARPAPYAVTLTSAEMGGSLSFTLEMQPLDAKIDRVTPAGMPSTHGPFLLAANGCYNAEIGTLTIPGETNPLTDSVLVAENVVFIGALCAGDSFCGVGTGLVTSPVELPIDGTTYFAEGIMAVADHTEPPILDCDGTAAEPL